MIVEGGEQIFDESELLSLKNPHISRDVFAERFSPSQTIIKGFCQSIKVVHELATRLEYSSPTKPGLNLL